MRTIVAALLLFAVGCRTIPHLSETADSWQVGFAYEVTEKQRQKIYDLVDARVRSWIDLKRGAYPEKRLKEAARDYPIVVYDDWRVDGIDPKKNYNGYWWEGSHIDIALYWGSYGAFYDGRGLVILAHELDHALLGDFHKGVDFRGPF